MNLTSTTIAATGISAASSSPYLAALEMNRASLQTEREQTQAIYARTIQTLQEGQEALRNENALMRAQLEDARRQAVRAAVDQEAARVASAAMGPQNTSQQEELAQLRPGDALLRRMVATIVELDRIGPENWYNVNYFIYNGLAEVVAIAYDNLQKQEKEKNFKRTGSYFPTPEHWGPILADLKRARDLIASHQRR